MHRFSTVLIFAKWLLSLGLALGMASAFAQRQLGIDVANYQGGAIDWASVKSGGVTFAWAKATEGLTVNDADFTINEANAVAAGVYIGAYHFAHPELHIGTAGADQEADHFWQIASNYIKGGGVYLMPMLDVERFTNNAAYMSQWVNQWCQDVVNYAAANGVAVKPIIYISSSHAQTWLDSSVTQWLCWIAEWPASPNPQTGAPSSTAPWPTWNVWQYTDSVPTPGATQNADGDVFNGSSSTLVSTLVISGQPVPYIISQPSSRYADQGGSISLRASAGGGPPLQYQWRSNGTNISGATNLSLTLSNIQTSNAGSYTLVVTNPYGSATSSVATLNVNGLFTPVFSDNFDMDSSANWTVNTSTADNRITFAYDYSAIGVPSAPNSINSTTKGLRFEANLANGVVAALSASPIGQGFSGNYRLHFDMWINVNGPLPGGGTGSTESLTAGVGTAGNSVQWNGAGSTADGVWFRVDGEGGVSDASTTQGDFMAFIGINQQAVGSGVYSAGAQSTARGNGDPYYANVFPAGQTPPAYEQSNYSQQTGSLAVGTVGLAWRDVVINKNGSTVEWFIDGLKIASLSGASLPGSNIFVGYWDPFASVSDNTNLSFGLVDNLRVEVPAAVPIVLVPPTNKTVNLGANATFSVNASGTAPLSYQWKLGATNLLGQTNNSFSLTNIQLAQAGTYSVVVSNIAGSATASASLSVVVVQISSASVAPDGLFHLLASGAPGGGYQVLASTNLANWISLGTFTNSTGTLQFTDPDSANFPARYYRLLAPK